MLYITKLDQGCGGRMSEIKVLEVNINDKGQGGAWAFIKNAINCDEKKEKIIFDFFTLEPFEDNKNIEFIEKNGGKIIVRYFRNKFIRQLQTYMCLKKYLNENQYDIVHIHSDVAFKLLIEGLASKKAGVKNIIFHSHCSGIDRGHRIIKRIAHNVCKPFLGLIGNDFFACSKLAGEWMYTKKTCQKLVIINNAVDCKKFMFNKEIREKIRAEFKIKKDTILVGHVGRFMYQKNHERLIDIFYELNKMNRNTKLILIGEGDLESKIRNKVNKMGLDNNVIFAGVRRDVNDCMQAMDLFLLPSWFEGLPVVGIEAQASGLPCVMSDTITNETNLFGLVKFIPLEKNDKIWAENCITLINCTTRANTYEKMVEAGYDISNCNRSLKKIYISIFEKGNNI